MQALQVKGCRRALARRGRCALRTCAALVSSVARLHSLAAAASGEPSSLADSTSAVTCSWRMRKPACAAAAAGASATARRNGGDAFF